MMDESVSQWLPATRTGDQRAAGRIYERYFHRLAHLARRYLGAAPRRVSDEEDVAIQTLHSFLRRVQRGSFPDLNNREDLWRVLACIARRKALNERRYWACTKRQATELPLDSVEGGYEENERPWTDAFRSPEAMLALKETRQRMIAVLDDSELRQIAEAKLDGYTNVEIAARVCRSVPTVERRVRLIRQTWEQEGLARS